MKVRTLSGMLCREYRKAEMYVNCHKCGGAFLVTQVKLRHTTTAYQVHLNSDHTC